MILSRNSDYAIRALSELVIMSNESPNGAGNSAQYILCDKLCGKARISRNYMAKLFVPLTKAKIISSRKGPGGGLALAKPAHDISLLSIVMAVNAKDQIDWCVVGRAKCNARKACPQHGVYECLRDLMRDYLQTTTLADTVACIKSTRKGR